MLFAKQKLGEGVISNDNNMQIKYDNYLILHKYALI